MVVHISVSDLQNGPHSNSHYLIKSEEDKIEVDNRVAMDTSDVSPTGPGGDQSELTTGPNYGVSISKDGDNLVNVDTVKKPYSDFINFDEVSAMSGDSGGPQDINSNASMTTSRSSSNKSPCHKPEKEKGLSLVTGRLNITNGKPLDQCHKKDKEKEREERIKQQKEKLAEERQKKLEEMKEQQRLAQEKREKQLELRRMKIEELKRRDEERRHAVEERRRRQETEEMARRESIIQKSQERITRFEQWKASGRKGHFGGGAPPNKQLSMSTSVLYNKRSSDIGGSTGNLSAKDRPGSLLALNTITEKRRSFIAGAGPPPTRPKSTINLHSKENVKLRERSTPRKPRPSSVATSMPSFMHVESPSPKMRSKSSDRINRDKPKPLPPQPKFTPKKETDKLSKDKKDKPDTRKSFAEKRKTEQQKKTEDTKKEGSPEKTIDKPTIKITQASIDRLSAPKQVKAKTDTPVKPEQVKGKVDTPVKPETPKTPQVRKSATFPRVKLRAAASKTNSLPVAPPTKPPTKPHVRVTIPPTKPHVRVKKPIKQRGKENKETPAKKSASQEKLDTKETPAKKSASQEKLDTKPATPTKQLKDASPSKMQVSFDSSILSSTDAIENDQLFDSIEDQTLPEMDTSGSEPSEKEGDKAVSLDDSLNKDIEEITDAVAAASEEIGAAASEEAVPDVVQEKSKSPSPVPDVVPVETLGSEPIEGSPLASPKEPSSPVRVISPTPKTESPPSPAKDVSSAQPAEVQLPVKAARDASPAPKATGTPASANKSQKELELEEYRAKLAEKRRQAREKAEREAELERQRQEQIRLEEEERQRKEEEEQKRIEEEAERLAEEARRLEGERLRKAIEAEEQRKREEAERAEQEKLAREEAEKKQKEEAERFEKEKIEKIKKEEEERNERKKKLAAIMSKVKSDKNLAASDSNLSTSSMTTSQSLSNLATSEDEHSGEELTVLDSTPKFKSPLLQKLVENKSNSSGNETPKFKSPLLQSLLGKKGRLSEKLDSDKSDNSSQKCDTDTKEERTAISADSNSDASDSSDNSVINADTVNNGVHNGHIKEMVDSSISMRTVDSSADNSLYGSLTDSASTADHKFEQIIDLSVNNYNKSEDLLNCNTNIGYDQEEETLPKPIIAFEDNATRRQEVADCS